jgi:hypothetical protein
MSEIATESQFTELDASRLYAKLVNELDAEPFVARLAPDVHYTSQWVLEEINDRERVAELLRGKMVAAAKSNEPRTRAVIGVATRYPNRGMPLVILYTGETSKPEATVSFDVADGLITRVSICILGVYKSALLDHPHDYVWPAQEDDQEPETTESARLELRRPEPEPAEIVATFADVLKTHYAPIEEADIEQARPVTSGSLEIALVSPEHPKLDGLDIAGLVELRESARRGEILLALVSVVESGVFAVVSWPRSMIPWTSPGKPKWQFLRGKRPADYMDFDSWCPLSFMAPYDAIRWTKRVIARPAPAIPIDELERRYREIERAHGPPEKRGIFHLDSWARFLDCGPHEASSLACNGGLCRLRERGEDTALATLVLDAWPNVAEHAAQGREYR